MEDFQQILPVTRVKKNFLDILKSMEQDHATIELLPSACHPVARLLFRGNTHMPQAVIGREPVKADAVCSNSQGQDE
ncbi:MAG: hypothetical protein J7L16_05330 [Deltaproteobacteria bacterium]|nr:hypothetical protein [Deltaproteobacteria bacterium]